jgi:hypothetical protein
MPLRGIVQVFEAIPDRIEVSGHEPTWHVTGGSFESVVAFARRAFDDPVVVARQDRGRWWPRVTLTVTKDPGLAADAPPLEVLADPASSPDPEPEPEPEPHPEPEPERVLELQPEAEAVTEQRVRLEDMFAYQEELRVASVRHRVPRQRHRR